MMNENQRTMPVQPEDKEIDLLSLVGELWTHRRRVLLWTVAGAIFGLVIAFSIPKEYAVTAKLVPESNTGGGGGFGALASMAGLGSMSKGGDAVDPELYPDVVKSVPFIVSLLDVEVENKNGEKITVQQCIEQTKQPWWETLISMPFKLIGMLKKYDVQPQEHKIDGFRLTEKEYGIVKSLAGRVNASYDNFMSLLTIDVQMQDPLVAAMLADTVIARLQEYITMYRTDKARKDLEFAEKINAEAQEDYYSAQKALADYSDRNQGIATQSAMIHHDRLENEAQLAFSLYNETSRRVQTAKALVQEKTPVCVVVSPPTVPITPVSPRKVLIIAGYMFLAAFACCMSILFIEPKIKSRKNNKVQQ